MARYRSRHEPFDGGNPFPSSGEDRLHTRLDPDTAQTRSPAYRLGFADNELLLRDELRSVRLQLEFLKPDLLQQDHGVEVTVAVFGSARILSPEVARERLAEAAELARLNPDDGLIAKQYRVAKAMAKKARYYNEAKHLAQLISATQSGRGATPEAASPQGVFDEQACGNGVASNDAQIPTEPTNRAGMAPVFVVTGGGPGIMEAANRGALEIGAESVAHNIVLPFEQMPNRFITPGLCFNFHYFALRKMHFLLRSVALVVFPGGYGTLDELFEVLTLIQTHKIRPIPVLLFGREYWERIIDFPAMVDEGVIDAADLNIFSYVETAEEAWALLEPTLRQAALVSPSPPRQC
jgi:uncharacterized protein (TIGR00730 family)